MHLPWVINVNMNISWIHEASDDAEGLQLYICAMKMLLQKKGAAIWTQRSSKRLKSVKSETLCRLKRLKKTKGKLIWKHNMATCICSSWSSSKLSWLKKKKLYVSGLVAEIIPSMKKCFQTMCPQHHLTVQSEQLVSSWRVLAPQPQGCSWGEKRVWIKVRNCCIQSFMEASLQSPTSSCCVWRSKAQGRSVTSHLDGQRFPDLDLLTSRFLTSSFKR